MKQACPGTCTLRLWAELLLLFAGVPVLMLFFNGHVRGLVIPLILIAALLCYFYLRREPGFERRRLWNARGFFTHLKRTLLVFMPLALIMAGFSYYYAPDRFLTFPVQAPGFWLLVMLLYPLLSAYPQELIYRVFFMRRYGPLFRRDWQVALASALAFGWAHVFLGNWVAPVFAFAGGWLFSRTYQRSGSLLQAAIDHGLWGDFLFTLGVGWYFYAGSIA